MFQFDLPAFRAQLRDRDTRRIIDDQLGTSDRADAFHDGIPVGIRQRTGTQLLGIDIRLHRQHTVDQLLFRHLQAEDQAGLLSADRDIIRNV